MLAPPRATDIPRASVPKRVRPLPASMRSAGASRGTGAILPPTQLRCYMLVILALLSCAGEPIDSGVEASDTAAGCSFSGGYVVTSSADPAPLTAGIQSEYSLQITDEAGCPIEDLQTNHERVIHSLFVSADLESFQHVHHEDFYELTVDNIRNATFHFPITFPTSGNYLAIYDFAHRNEWFKATETLTVTGDIPQLPAYREDYSETVIADDLSVSIEFESSPVAGFESAFNANISEADGTPVGDLIQYLGSDGHLAVVSGDLSYANHTHAWFPGMGDMAPTMQMPHLYTGPDLPFVFTFPVGGTYKMWVQFRRESRPDFVYAVPFMLQVGG